MTENNDCICVSGKEFEELVHDTPAAPFCKRCGDTIPLEASGLCSDCEMYIEQGCPREIPERYSPIGNLRMMTTGSGVCKRCGASLGSSPSFWNFRSGLCIGCDPVFPTSIVLNDLSIPTKLLEPEGLDTVNKIIRNRENTNDISDGFHTFGELYEHRIELFVTLCRKLMDGYDDLVDNESQHGCGYPEMWKPKIWRSKKHNDGTELSGWFIMGIGKKEGEQITYHLPINKWDECDFAETLDTAPPWDGHTSADVLERLKQL